MLEKNKLGGIILYKLQNSGGKIMKKYIFRRTLWLIITFLMALAIAFFIYSQLQGSILSVDATVKHKIAKNIPKISAMYNFDKPIYIKFALFIKKFFTNKLVLYSLDVNQAPIYIMPMILQGVKTNMILIFLVVIFGTAVSIPLGMHLSKGKKAKISNLIIYLGMSVPGYVLAAVIFYKYITSALFYKYVATHTTAQIDSINGNLKDYVIPFVALSIVYISQCTKRIKVTIADVRKKEFITTANAYGCSKRTIEYKYILKNSLPPIITFIGVSFSTLFSELIVVQTALGSNGLGAFFLSMVHARQYDAVFACVTFIIAIIAIVNYLVDLLYFVVDPRITVHEK